MAPGDKTVKSAVEELRAAVQGLAGAIDGRFDREMSSAEYRAEVRRVHQDRASSLMISTSRNSGRTGWKKSTARSPAVW